MYYGDMAVVHCQDTFYHLLLIAWRTEVLFSPLHAPRTCSLKASKGSQICTEL